MTEKLYPMTLEGKAKLEAELEELKVVKRKEIVERNNVEKDVVSLGRKITFIELPDGEEESYTIVGSAEANPIEGKISNDSPIAKGIIGKKLNDEVVIQTPGGDMKVKITKIESV